MERIAHIGIDPGKKGFITLFKDNEFTFYPMPESKFPTGDKLKSGKDKFKTEYDESRLLELALQLRKITKGYKVFAKIEQVTGRNGWAAEKTFNFGYVAGMQKMILFIIGAEIEMVRPQKWQSFIYKGYNIIKVPSSTGKTMVNDPKATSELVATTEYPKIDFRKTVRATKNDDNKVDSFLLCLYSIRRHK